MLTKIQAIKCPKCFDIIYSRARHDYHYCSCGTNKETHESMGISVDGGFDYLRYGWANDIKKSEIEILEIELNVSEQELFNDWNKRIDRYGCIPDRKVFLSQYLLNKHNIFKLFLDIKETLDNKYAITEQMYCEDLYGNKT